MTGYTRTSISSACIEPDTESRRTAVCVHLTVIGYEVVLRILCRDTTLHGIAAHCYSRLLRHPGRIAANRTSFGDSDLGLDDIYSSDSLRHRVFNLDSRVDLYKIKLTTD